MAKRLFDILLAVFALLLCSPFLLAVAVWIRLDSPGPVFFRQARVGRNEQLFYMYKFRTMHVGAEAAGLPITVGNDPRITRPGAWLRRTKMDELPQFINVLRGEMSVVGPRPEVPRYVALYPQDVRDAILSLRPGITDLASIAFRDESALLAHSSDPETTYIHEILPIKLRYASDYARTHSVWMDAAIVWRTAAVLLGRPRSQWP